ncbi:asparagine--tRNA ligase [Chlamydiales bacterium]|nr:asparagine--tRNA ligase [Chlamydiales bacterium]
MGKRDCSIKEICGGIVRTRIRKVKEDHSLIGKSVEIKGWLRTVRDQKKFCFLDVNDGSTLVGIQVIIPEDFPDYQNIVSQLSVGASVKIKGDVVESPGEGQKVEVIAKNVVIVGKCDPSVYPLQKKRHSFEFLRTIGHLRPRTNTMGAVMRVRNTLAFATHEFFQQQGFCYLQTPIITGSDCEGAGEMFQVTTLNLENPPKTVGGSIDYEKDFFGKPSFLTVSGQLNAEAYALALSDVYTFGPTFRAENSNTSRHLAEFWMIEPEMAFADLKDDQDLAEDYLKFVIQKTLERNEEDLSFFDKYICKGLIERLKHVLETPFERVSYTFAVRILEKSGKKFEYPVKWGADLQSEHERYLAEEYFKKPVILTDYPKEIKAFYMRDNDDDKTVAAMDVLVPGIGEIIGGAQREDRLDILEKKIHEVGLNKEDYWWYLELRKYGSVPHSGFGVGFERLVRYLTGVENIREAIAFPRSPGNALF